MLDFCAEHGVIPQVEMITGEDTAEAYDNTDSRVMLPLRHRHSTPPDRVSVRGMWKPWAERSWGFRLLGRYARDSCIRKVSATRVLLLIGASAMAGPDHHAEPTPADDGEIVAATSFSNRSPVRPLCVSNAQSHQRPFLSAEDAVTI